MKYMTRARTCWLVVVLFAIAMAWLESATVYYLRLLVDRLEPYQANPLPISGPVGDVELVREAATLFMLLTVGILAGKTWQTRLGYSAIAFGVWDIFYYVFLWVFLRWPESLLTWDVLFLIPVPWLGPVLAPVIVSLALIVSSLWLWRLKLEGHSLHFSGRLWSMAIFGGALVLLSFMIDFQSAVALTVPAPYRWDLFAAGVGLALLALGLGAPKRVPRHSLQTDTL